MQPEDELKLARQMLFEAEAELENEVHCGEYDHQRRAELAEKVRFARRSIRTYSLPFTASNAPTVSSLNRVSKRMPSPCRML